MQKINEPKGTICKDRTAMDINKLSSTGLIIGLDVGSTTVKAVVMTPDDKKILWKRYQRHEIKQPELVENFLIDIMNNFDFIPQDKWRVFISGIGGEILAPILGAKYVHETNAITLAVEELHPDAGSVIELGGQDAKVIIWKEDPNTGNKQVFTSMNDKCAGGTGVTIDKTVARVGIAPDDLTKMKFDNSRIHHIAAKCGVFAETDVVNLLKSGISAEEIMASLAEAIVIQNLSVLTRGNILRHNVYLLGGPNAYLPFLQQCWKKNIPEIWKDRNWHISEELDPESLIIVPDNAEYYTAIGSVYFGLEESNNLGIYKGINELKNYIQTGRNNKAGNNGVRKGLIENQQELIDFKKQYEIPAFQPAKFEKGTVVKGIIGMDGGSTSSKAVLIDLEGKLLGISYQLSNGNPIQDTKDLLIKLRDQVHCQGATLEVLGFGVTGYAGDVLKETMNADVNLVETVAHMKSAVYYYGDVDVIMDIGGQDIKVLFMENGRVKDFKLNSQCSAGNGYFLQGMANQFGIDVTEYADHAFQAEYAPIFNYGCAVFMEQDKVNFQQLGWQKEEMMAGLALVLPLNIWQYIVQEPNLRKFGNRFVLQGGTQYNLAAVKAQVDYIKKKVPDSVIHVHKYTGVAGAIGVALEALSDVSKKGTSSFIGLEDAIGIQYTATNNTDTKCYFCQNHCSRTYVDTTTPSGKSSRFISGYTCEKGSVENKQALRELNKQTKELKKQFPNLVEQAAKSAFRSFEPQLIPDNQLMIKYEKQVNTLFRKKLISETRAFQRTNRDWLAKRAQYRIGIPKVLNLFATAPFWRSYFEALAIPANNIVFSDFTTDELWSQGGKWGSIDPCFPAKVANAHVHNLIFKKSTKDKPINMIFFPIITHFLSTVENTIDSANCATSAGCPEVVKAAFTREKDIFAENNILYHTPFFKMDEANLFKEQLLNAFQDILGLTTDENEWAYEQGMKALEQFDSQQKQQGKLLLEQLKINHKVGILLLGRPYHNDPGLNHDILESLQAMGFPILSMQSLPHDKEFLQEIFGEDLAEEYIKHPLEVNDVWKNCFSENGSYKIWAAKVAVRHPNLVIIDLSNFKCGHDAPLYGLIDDIVKTSKTPHFTFHDIDENKPSGSIKIRTRTIKYFLDIYETQLARKHQKEQELYNILENKRLQLLERVQKDLDKHAHIQAEKQEIIR